MRNDQALDYTRIPCVWKLYHCLYYECKLDRRFLITGYRILETFRERKYSHGFRKVWDDILTQNPGRFSLFKNFFIGNFS